jgi:ribonuclease T1
MRNSSSGSKWMVLVAAALLAAVALTTFRTADDIVPGAPVASDPARDASKQTLPGASPPLEAPPPMADVASPAPAAAYPDFLPAEAIDTLRLIERGGPYPYRQDDGVFGNREGRLPRQARDYYREYTVETPGSRDRGARRIVAGGRPPVEYFYTDDHYRSFRRFTLDGSASAGRETSR